MAIESRANYRSPFTALKEQGLFDAGIHANGTITQVRAPLSQIIAELDTALANPDDSASKRTIALHPPRLIRATLDWEIKYDTDRTMTSSAIDLGLRTYSNPTEVSAELATFRDALPQDLLDSAVVQAASSDQWEATDPELSQKTAISLAQHVGNNSVLFVAIGHGGTAPGMDTFHQYSKIVPGNTFDVVRLSPARSKDMVPQVSEKHQEELQRKAQETNAVVIFDESAASGRTLETTRNYLSKVFPDKYITTVTNTFDETLGFDPEASRPDIVTKTLY